MSHDEGFGYGQAAYAYDTGLDAQLALFVIRVSVGRSRRWHVLVDTVVLGSTGNTWVTASVLVSKLHVVKYD